MERTALITGASRGIGLAIANLLSENGFKVVKPTRTEMDLLSNGSIDSYLSSLKEPIDILINNAGINPLAGSMEILDSEIFNTLQVNIVGPIRLIKGIVPGMIERKYGRIINISSIWSNVSKPRRLIYSTTKSGLNGLTRNLAIELAKFNILVNAVAPGFTNTELTQKNNTEAEIKLMGEAVPLQRLAEPREIAELVMFLCSDKNSYITGQTIFIDGGYTCL